MASCYDCQRPYGDDHGFPDLIIPLWAWRQISPSGDEGGLLCPSCILHRLWSAGLSGVPAALMSGPARTVAPEAMDEIRKMENLAERATERVMDIAERLQWRRDG